MGQYSSCKFFLTQAPWSALVAVGHLREKVPCSGTAPNLTLDLNAKQRTHLFWDAREATQEGSEASLRKFRALPASVPPRGSLY